MNQFTMLLASILSERCEVITGPDRLQVFP